ncbi:DUF4350 domain-containing protein [Allonocardiopsis opalescens]|uniref:DUF4350 domain-containing protein n=1 Tax=Allonocardiopsis opalescens TaxID=1144618 RepID=A0A2T0QCD8_9ACTN|nr:DUF4350 domain-containing protein [Allonocardiopsis opalescens]PRY01513.1 hypothetical protein CLV72_10195 [Allonocardiopsis opalescens]
MSGAPSTDVRDAGTARSVTLRDWVARWRPLILIVAGVVLLAVVFGLLSSSAPTGRLDPEAPDREGSRAVAEIHRERGGRVDVARGLEQAAGLVTGDSLLVVVDGGNILPDRAPELAELAGGAGAVLLVEPPPHLLSAVVPGVAETGSTPVRTRAARCPAGAAGGAAEARMGGALYTADELPGAVGCFPAQGGAALLRAELAGRPVTVLGTGEPLQNGRLLTADDAALALNLLGEREHVVWLIPDPPPPGSGQPVPLDALIPREVVLGAVQLGIGVVLVALWRARRLGPVVAERLPVVVRASETVEGRARLYRSRRAADRVVEALRLGARERLRARLGLPADAAAAQLVRAVSARTGRPGAEVDALLYGSVPPGAAGTAEPSDDAALVRFADALDTLEREVRRS